MGNGVFAFNIENIMRIFDGTLRVETINGRRGPFNVGKLITDIGEFKVKDKALDQFEPGEYTGNFLVEAIYTASNPWRGGVFTEMLCRIAPDGFLIVEEEVPQVDQGSQLEPDPLDSEQASPGGSDAPMAYTEQPKSPAPVSKPAKSTVTEPAAVRPVAEPSDADLVLFGIEIHELFANGQDIALDPTVEREQFRLQRTRLKDCGYRFIAQEQIWKK